MPFKILASVTARRSYLKDLYGCTDEEAEAMMVSEVYEDGTSWTAVVARRS